MLLQRTAEFLVFPPANIVLFLLLAGVIGLVWPKLRIWIVLLGVMQLLLLSMPIVAEAWYLQLRLPYIAKPQLWSSKQPDAIVVLGAGRNIRAREFDDMQTPSTAGMERLRYAALLHQKTGVPILIAGGQPFRQGLSEAALMARVLREEYKVEVRWLEEKSHTTWENAMFSDVILQSEGIKSAWLVTQDWHMARAMQVFSRGVVEYIPASVSYNVGVGWNQLWFKYIPQAKALSLSSICFHEWLGILWYKIKHSQVEESVGN